ncbi:MAG: hypothetical protein H7Y60_00710 [Rhodospirillaceae bacterium]|nr:hypothetical protein [Rhodospirillales bacterium]
MRKRLRFDFGFAALAASFMVFCAVANAQTAPANATTSPAQTSAANVGIPPASDVIAVPVWPKAALPLPEQPVATSFNLGQIEGVPAQLVTGVTANGYARKVTVEDQTVGQVLVMTVAKGDRTETISTEGMTAQWDAKETSQLFPEKNLEVKGSKTALVAALQRLAEPKVDDEKKKVEKDSVNDNPVSNGGKTGNDQAASYRTPTVAAAAPEQKDPVVDVRTSRDGCDVRIDVAQGKAFVQSKEQTFTDGALTSDGTCTDSEVSYPLKKSQQVCPTDIVDIDTLQAWPQFQWYYVDEAGENHPVGECGKDEETVYTITEDEGQCPVNLDFLEQKAVPQSAFVYIGRNNALTQVPGKGCATSTKSSAIPMDENKAACPMRPDFVANLSYELSMWTYVRNGVTYQAAPCADTDRTFPHEIVYADAAGNNICPAITNMTTKKVTLQSRRRIIVDGTPQWASDCTPDTSIKDILSTTAPCMDPSKWTHDLDAGLSFGQERFYYNRVDGTPEYVTPCQNSTKTYPHDETITGYQAHDDQLWAYPLSTVKITVNGAPYTVASSEVLPGAAQLNYLPAGTVDQPTGQSFNQGCTTSHETARYERWSRPDGTEYLKSVGLGTPVTIADNCVTTVITSQNLQTGAARTAASYNGETFVWYDLNWYQTVNKIQKKNQANGEIVATTCAFANNGTWKGWSVSYTNTGMGGWPTQTVEYQTLFIPPCPF